MARKGNGQILLAEYFEEKAARLQSECASECMSIHYYFKSAHIFKLAKSWVRAGKVYEKLAQHLAQLHPEDYSCESVRTCINAAHCYVEEKSLNEATRCFEMAIKLLSEYETSQAADYYVEIGQLYENDDTFGEAMEFYIKAACLYGVLMAGSTESNQCWAKAAESAAKLGNYRKASEIYKEMAHRTIKDKMLRLGVNRLILYGGICQLCMDSGAFFNVLEQYQNHDLYMEPKTKKIHDLYAGFLKTREYKYLEHIATSMNKNISDFANTLEKSDYRIPLAEWMRHMLLKVVQENPKASSSGTVLSD